MYPFLAAHLAHLLGLVEIKHGITINNVLPGTIEELDHEEAFGALRGESPRSLFFDPTDVAAATSSSDLATFRGLSAIIKGGGGASLFQGFGLGKIAAWRMLH